MSLSGIDILAAIGAVVVAAVLAGLVRVISIFLAWDKDTSRSIEVYYIIATVVAILVGAWAGWELVQQLANTNVDIRIGT